MAATTVLDVILGEAKGGDINDMMHIASVIENRARALGVTPEQVVQDPREFSAYGKPLPPGVSRYREQAAQALQQVRTQGPVTDAMFYATPAAKGNLPRGLQQTAQTDGHVFFTDPQLRPIRTATGVKPVNALYVQPDTPFDPEAMTDKRLANPDTRPANAMQLAGREIVPGAGLANLTANPRDEMAGIQWSLGPKRPARPNENITNLVRQSVSDLGPEYGVIGVSGRGPYGSFRHRQGDALDFALTRNGQRINVADDPIAYQGAAQSLAARGGGGIGHYGWGLHADVTGSANAWGPDTRSRTLSPDFRSAINSGREGFRATPMRGPDIQERPSQSPMTTPQDQLVAQAPDTMGSGILSGRNAVPLSAFNPIGTAQATPFGASGSLTIAPRTPNVAPVPSPAPRDQFMVPVPSPRASVAPLPVNSPRFGPPRQINMADQYGMYRPAKDVMPSFVPTPNVAPVPTPAPRAQGNVPVWDMDNQFPEAPKAPLGQRIRENIVPFGAAAAGAALGGVPGALAGRWLGQQVQGRGGILSMPGFGGGMLSQFMRSEPMQPTQFVNARDFNHSLGFGGSSRASDYVQSGAAPAGTAYRDSAGGQSVSLGNGYSERTNRFGVREITTPEGRTVGTFSSRSDRSNSSDKSKSRSK